MKVTAIILVGGSSTRFGSDIPKQFYKVNGKPLLAYTLDCFENNPEINDIVIVANPTYKDNLEELLNTYPYKKISHLVEGGKNRQESAFFGLLAIENETEKMDRVLIHDGVRPIVPPEIIHELLLALNDHFGATVAIPSTDTMCLIDKNNEEVVGTLNREEVYAIQTPQAFVYQAILEAHKLYQGKNVTDDSQLLSGVTPIKIVKGNKKLLKITTKEDILFLEVYLKEAQK